MSILELVSPAGFEPALPKEPELKSGALDHSAIETNSCLTECIYLV